MPNQTGNEETSIWSIDKKLTQEMCGHSILTEEVIFSRSVNDEAEEDSQRCYHKKHSQDKKQDEWNKWMSKTQQRRWRRRSIWLQECWHQEAQLVLYTNWESQVILLRFFSRKLITSLLHLRISFMMGRQLSCLLMICVLRFIEKLI